MLTEEALKYLRSFGGYTDVAQGDPYPSRVVALPEGSELASLERFQARPNRTQHTATVDSAASFVAYVNRYAGPETSVYLDIVSQMPSFRGVIDHHGKESPDWREHQVQFAPRVSLEWKAWTTLHEGGPVNQAELLAFFEDHANDLLNPAPSVMLGHLHKFEAVEKHTYHSAMNLDNGAIQVTYTKDAAKRTVEFPHTVQLNIPVIENEEPLVLDGRLRFKTGEGRIAFAFQFKQDPTRILRDTLRDIAKRIAEETPEVKHYEGRVGSR